MPATPTTPTPYHPSPPYPYLPHPSAGGGKSWRLVVPPPRLCTDNGLMVAWAAVEMLRLGICHEAEGKEVRARWPLGFSAIDESDLELLVDKKKKKKAS